MGNEDKNNAEKDEIDLTKLIKKLKKNNYFFIFTILTLIVLFLSIFSAINLNLGNNIINKGLHLFPSWIFFLLLGMLALSSVSAYYEKYSLMFLPILFWIIFTSSYIRTTNIESLKDITTGDYTLGPDLDPFLYLRHAKEISEGSLQNPDIMAYAPVGSTNYALKNLMPLAIFLVFKIASIFSSISITYAAIIAPVIFFGISIIGFFLFNRSIFSIKFSKNLATTISIIASSIYIVLPQMLHRTTGGIPEIESLGMVWLWFALFFFTLAWKKKGEKNWIIYGVLAGIFTGLMSWTWGGYRYLYLAISLTSLVFLLFEKDRKKNFVIFFSWIFSALIIELLKTQSFIPIVSRISDTGTSLVILFIFLVDILVAKAKLKETLFKKLPLNGSLLSILLSILALIAILLIIAPGFLMNAFSGLIEGLLYPFGRGRVGLTVAENKLPYFSEILGNFGNLFWLFLAGSIVLFWDSLKHIKKNKRIALTFFFLIFLSGLSFSRISPSSSLNGDNFISQAFYLSGIILFIFSLLYIYYKAKRSNDENTLEGLKKIEVSDVLILALSFLALISMRGPIRLLIIIAPLITILAAYIPVKIIKSIKERKQENKTNIFTILLLIISIVLIGTAWINYSQNTSSEAKATIPGAYEQYWQKSMDWVRKNTPEGSIFVHWWDYGYWIQTIGERPTVTDGGHFTSYWDHLIGRYVLTTPYPETALSFMKAHNVSYLLIDQTDLGKYSAYSSIGNDDEVNDRASWIPIMLLDPKQMQETSNSTTYVYIGGTVLDKDILYNKDGKETLLPEGKAGLGGVIIKIEKNETNEKIAPPTGVFVYNGQQFEIPIRKIYLNGNLLDFKYGINATIFLIPTLENSGTGGLGINNMGGIIYLSEKVQDGLFAQLYLMNDPQGKYSTVSLEHTEPDLLVANIRSQGAGIGDFVYYQGFRGPMKIWKVNYPDHIIAREEFLRLEGKYGEFDNLEFTK
ncbi:MAG: STT3 domain-containing protein [Nanoarchaeota archaeon]